MAEDDWGTWKSKTERAYTRGLDVTAEERLQWLEEMLEIAFAAGALPKARDEWGRRTEPKR